MEELHAADDQSHYEISLTAGQAFAAFVLLLLSLAASFGFGLMIGKGQADERLVVQKETPVVTEAALTPKKTEGRIVELGVADDEFQEPTETAETTAVTETPAATETAAVIEEAAAPSATETPVQTQPASATVRGVTTYAQLLSTENKLTAEMLAAKLIDRGFTAAYVERGTSEKGPIYRVRVKFDSDAEARAAEPKLREFSKDVWITTK